MEGRGTPLGWVVVETVNQVFSSNSNFWSHQCASGVAMYTLLFLNLAGTLPRGDETVGAAKDWLTSLLNHLDKEWGLIRGQTCGGRLLAWLHGGSFVITASAWAPLGLSASERLDQLNVKVLLLKIASYCSILWDHKMLNLILRHEQKMRKIVWQHLGSHCQRNLGSLQVSGFSQPKNIC